MTLNQNMSGFSTIPADACALALDVTGVAAAVFGQDDALRSANRVWLRDHGLTASEAAGAPALRCWPGDDARERVELIRRVRRSGVPVIFREQRDGRSVESAFVPLASGEVLALSTPGGLDRSSWPAELSKPELVGAAAHAADRVASLSRREREVFTLLASGHSIKQVAERLGRSEKTIEGHRDSIYRKLGTRNRAQIAVLAMESGLLPPHGAATMAD
ncbi:MAG: LuxR family transcriptional regulator [Planctomycetota bacterium]|nr:MAG: LuxR family transcriptional regulator [Planctomycetota bacterium]